MDIMNENKNKKKRALTDEQQRCFADKNYLLSITIFMNYCGDFQARYFRFNNKKLKYLIIIIHM